LARDAQTRECLLNIREMIDFDAAISVWNDALKAGPWSKPPVWFHGDLHHGNLLVANDDKASHLSAVIDFGFMGVGDPACDLMSAWGLFSGDARTAFRKTVAVDDATWKRGRGFALSQAAIYIPYYLHTKPIGVRNALRAINHVIEYFNAQRDA
jgi:aminoglycoside phosphotransferase (APT) family kinase protein